MPIITWEKKYSVGVAELDDQHKQLIGMINELYFAMSQDRGQALVNNIIAEMLVYAKKHFAAEEAYMYKCEYLGVLQHYREHEQFIKKTEEFIHRTKEGAFILSFEVIQYLSDWLKCHILESDMRYVPLFKEKGLR